MPVIPFNTDWTYRRPLGPFAAAGEPVPAKHVHLPHDALRDERRSPDAAAKGAEAYYPAGAYTYSKTFEVPAEWQGRIVRLEIEGAYRRAQIFLNDEFAGNRADGYARFFVDLTPYLKFGEQNLLRIETRSGQDSRWYSGAGLHRPVRLHVDRPVHVPPDGVHIDTVRLEDDQAVIEVRTAVRNAGINTRTTRVHTQILGPNGTVLAHTDTPSTLSGGEEALVRQRFYLPDAALWSVDRPALHRAHITLDDETDAHDVDFGIRTITVDPRKGLRINGEPVLLRGACIHGDNGPLGAASIGRAEERRIELLRAAGFNALRAAHNPLPAAMLQACDRLGMLVMDEAFDMWTRFKTPYDYASEFPQWHLDDLAAMVAKDRNHPSVIMYSIGNEIAETGTPHGARWARRLAEHVRSLDPTRPVTNGVNALLSVIDEMPSIVEEIGGLNEAMADGDWFSAVGASATASARIEESSAALDVLGLNYAEGRYEPDATAHPNRVIVGSETFPSQIGRLWPMVVASPNVIGDFTWTGWDYLGEVGLGATAYEDEPSTLEREFPFLTAWSGDIDITGHRRPVSYYREIVFGLRTEPYIAVQRPAHYGRKISARSPWGWSDSVSSWTWPGFEDRRVVVEVYADADEVALLLDGNEIARAAVGTTRRCLAEIETAYLPGTLVAISYRDGHEMDRTTLTTAGEPRLCVTADRDRLVADDDDLAFVSIEIRDREGHLVTGDDREITVAVDGPGTLAGLGSAQPRTTERFDATQRRTFDGRALAVIRPTGGGHITVMVTSAGLNTTSAEIEVKAWSPDR
ncbi:glycoside hydrolase family 2 TIM barrel-domain containing protein [Actinoplanes sp. NBRC 101535]|uniref:glycoside hydrolase family 2 TIM barrel-domain containing protein n=1 Tax=Actinoplanes sp. NBRC 101535 TaxID=3032196 RepID=UPI0024A33B52|nr:glycoside hydrolase family 2 TIM barrel-domain containing protein [Actinoplanes sp. NBRC 101535]GLY07766.1 beta-galactosidase [Actinoplanes sp. NBRC 101535]